jgi:uncharacterized membrane protein YoaK (UPF0700 family)
MLSLAAGSIDAFCLLQLGGVFASVITGNLVVLAASAVRGQAGPVVNALTSVGAYGVGVFAGSRIEARLAPASRATTCLALETLVLAVLVAAWFAANLHQADGGPQPPLLVLAGAAMGLQSVAVRGLGRPGLSTTHLTGALTRIVSSVGESAWSRRLEGVQILALCGLAVGAAVETVFMRCLPWIGPIPAAVVTAAAVLVAYRWCRTEGRQHA